MTKKTFLRKLETKLYGLDEKEITKIIKKYEAIIDEEIVKGKNERDVITSLGNIDLIVKLYKTNNIDDKKVTPSKDKEDTSDTNFIDKIFKYIQDVFKTIDDKLAKRILMILCFIAVLIILLAILNIPFRIIEVMGFGVLRIAFNNYHLYNFTSTLWSISINICYIILVIWLVYQYVNKISFSFTGATKKEKKEAPQINENKESPQTNENVESINIKNNNDNSISNLIFSIIKIFIVFLTFPFIIVELVLIITFALLIYFIIIGITLYGPALIILGLSIMLATLLSVIYTSLFKEGKK